MTPVTSAKLALAVIGALCFGAGIRADNSALRYVGIGFFAAAFLLRFIWKEKTE